MEQLIKKYGKLPVWGITIYIPYESGYNHNMTYEEAKKALKSEYGADYIYLRIDELKRFE